MVAYVRDLNEVGHMDFFCIATALIYQNQLGLNVIRSHITAKITSTSRCCIFSTCCTSNSPKTHMRSSCDPISKKNEHDVLSLLFHSKAFASSVV